jgi:hypothetical protein
MKLVLFVSVLLFYPTFVLSQVYCQKDIEICNSKFKIAENANLKMNNMGDIICSVGESFIGTDYKAYTLETEPKEKLVVNLTGLDCTTFLENVLAISRLVKKDSTSFDNFIKELTYIRYRNGIIDSYPSRLHYFSDWIYDNAGKNVIKDITEDLGGIAIKFQINFMSEHVNLYKHLKENPSFIPVIKKQEKSINNRSYFYIPKDNVSKIESKLSNGDIVAFTTYMNGLDIGHVGIAVDGKDGRIHLLHAPQPNTKVQITQEPLSDYISKLKKDTGIIVLRALNP